jgi:hypothetical protein
LYLPYQYNDQINKKAIELLDAITSVTYSRKGLGYTIGRGLDDVLPFTCWFSYYFDQRKIYESPEYMLWRGSEDLGNMCTPIPVACTYM